MRLFFWVLIGLCPCMLHASDAFEHEQILQRIEPIGRVHLKGEQIAPRVSKQLTVKSVKLDKGQTIYQRHCIACHQNGLAGAPKFRDSKDWQSRLVDKKIDELVNSAIKGKNAMPAKGTCYSCSDDEIKAAITYMISTHD